MATTIPYSLTYAVSAPMELGFCVHSYEKFVLWQSERAIKELEFLLDAQWKNGMLPQIVYANKKNKKEDTFFPSAEFYDVTRSPNAPRHVKTSAITQPPLHATYIVFYCIYKNTGDEERERAKGFLGKISCGQQAALVIDLIMDKHL